MCAARASGVRIFQHSNTSTVTGCTAHPGHEQKCSLHREDDSPVLEYLPNDIKQKMRVKRTRSKAANPNAFRDDRDDDEIFIVEKVLKRKKDQLLIQCVGYEPEWMESSHIPSFILEHFHATGKPDIPSPYIHSSNKTGSIMFQSLSWKSDGSLPTWMPETSEWFQSDDPDPEQNDIGSLRCNTRKDKAGHQNFLKHLP